METQTYVNAAVRNVYILVGVQYSGEALHECVGISGAEYFTTKLLTQSGTVSGKKQTMFPGKNSSLVSWLAKPKACYLHS